MKKVILCLVAVATFACSNAQKKEFSEASLSKKLTTIENTQISFKEILKRHAGKITVIEVWASWCGDCVKAMPKVKAIQENFPEADYVFISMDKEFEKWMNGIKVHELKGDHYWATDGMKGEFGKSIDLDWIPRYIIVGTSGEVLMYRAIETDFGKINDQLKALIKKDVKTEKLELKTE